MDCGLGYEFFPLDVLLPRAQWLEIHPADGGLLCAKCIVERLARLPGVTCVRAMAEIAPRSAEPLIDRIREDLKFYHQPTVDAMCEFVIDYLERADRQRDE